MNLAEIDNLEPKRASALELYGRYKKLQAKSHDLTYLFWECTLRCNLDCLHCGSDCMRESTHPDMPLADFLTVLDQVDQHMVPQKTLVVLTGGEPLLRKDLEEAGREFTRRGNPWGFVTNGYAMTEERFGRLLEAGLRSMTISLDGLAENHDHFRGKKQSFAKAIQAIGWAAKQEQAGKIAFDVVTCVNKENLAELPQVRSMLVAMGVRRWRIATVFAKGRATTNPIFALTDQEFAQVFAFIAETRQQGQIRANYGCEGYLGNLEGQVRDNPFFCRAGVNIGSVLIDGSISACPSLRADFIQGNIYKDDFWNVWENQFEVMRDRSWAKTGKCAECTSWDHCEGNGLHLRDERTGHLLHCHIERLKNAI